MADGDMAGFPSVRVLSHPMPSMLGLPLAFISSSPPLSPPPVYVQIEPQKMGPNLDLCRAFACT
eukprot:512659-Pyramimonas_sp.AAC.1